MFKKKKKRKISQLNDEYTITINDHFIKVEHPKFQVEQMWWVDIDEIAVYKNEEDKKLATEWLVLFGKGKGCGLPIGTSDCKKVLKKVSKYEGFDMKLYKSFLKNDDMGSCTVWSKQS